jgi:hypothetical protein
MGFIDELSGLVYTEDSIGRAKEYLIGRGIDPDRMKYPSALTSDSEYRFKKFAKKYNYPSRIFINNLYIPVIEMLDPESLAGFDIRYCGIISSRIRWAKFKRSTRTLMVDGFYEAVLNIGKPVVVVESIIDAETIRCLDLPVNVITPLSAVCSIRFASFLYMLTNKVLFMYDNDEAGQKATQRMLEYVGVSTEVYSRFKRVTYKGKDPNESVEIFGKEHLTEVISEGIK